MIRGAWPLALGACSLLALLDLACLGDDGPAIKPAGRKLLYPTDETRVARSLRPFVRQLLAGKAPPVKPTDPAPSGAYVRVVTRRNILAGGKLKDEAWLGTHPFVFLTTPENLAGASLLEVYSRIGYSADQVLSGQLGEEKVAIVFRYDGKVRRHGDRAGKLPADCRTGVYPATWDNLFALLEKLAGDDRAHVIADKSTPFSPSKLRLRSAKERLFVLGFPEAGKKRLRTSSYHALQEIGGADWEYRRILERTLGAALHYTGDGTCKPTFVPRDRKVTPAVEFLGPNSDLKSLAECAVVGLGALKVSE